MEEMTMEKTRKQMMIEKLSADRRLGRWEMISNPHAGPEYFTAMHGAERHFVHVAIDGSVRYSDTEKFGEFFSWGMAL